MAVPAGLGLASVMTRHPAILAMELAGLARVYPGRTRAAVGLGNTQWLRQMGLLPQRPLTALTETIEVLRELLGGAGVDRRTSTHLFDEIALAYPPQRPPEVWVGAVNQRALGVAGARADGVLLSVLSDPAYVGWARRQVEAARRPEPPITAFVLTSVDRDEQAARDAVREAVGFFLRAESHTALVGRSEHGPEIRDRVAGLADDDPLVVEDAWIDEFAVAGNSERVRDQFRELLAAGADSLGLWLFPPNRFADQLRRIAHDVLPAGMSEVGAMPTGGGSLAAPTLDGHPPGSRREGPRWAAASPAKESEEP